MRLTQEVKIRGHKTYRFSNGEKESKGLTKLGQYEDIEQEFQIDNFDDLRDRLTKYKFLASHEMSCVDVEGYNCMLKDLKEYHNIEEKLGIKLTTYFKIKYANSICFKKTYFLSKVGSFSKGILVFIKGRQIKLLYKDYGKTWALAKEELL